MSEEPSSVQPSEDLPEPDIQTQPDERDLQALEMIRKVCHAGDFHVEPKIRCIEGSYLQVELVRRWRAGQADERVQTGIHISINGIAAGLRNTG